MHADLIVDEITAHARAAYELNPKTDTIIEIGGQDSKFTLMHDGMVTFSQMNAVCAAGTGSFLRSRPGSWVARCRHIRNGPKEYPPRLQATGALFSWSAIPTTC